MPCRGFPEAWTRLYEMNSLDMEFYHYALKIAESQHHLPKAQSMLISSSNISHMTRPSSCACA